MHKPGQKAGLSILVLIMLAEGWYAVKLNRDFYREHIPFFDSCAYTNQLASVWSIERSSGIAGAIKSALHGNVALPWLEEAALAPFLMPSRVLGIWLQWLWLVLLALSLFWYFTQYRDAGAVCAVCLTLPFVSFARVYDWNGGLIDFRMDLSLYIFLSLTAVWYLIACRTDSAVPWLMAGLSAMLACLARATAPVYLLVTLGPLLAVRLWRASHRRSQLVRHILWMSLPIAFGLLFQVYNFRFLYFYYAVSEGDANRHLPLSQSAMHLLLAGSHLGVATALCSLAVLGLSFQVGIVNWIRQVDYEVLWMGLAAPAFLMFARAGLNPFVTMPAVFGLLLFSYFPLREDGTKAAHGNLRWATCALLAGSSLFNAVQAKRPSLFTGADVTRMSGMKTLIGRIDAQAAARHQREVRYIIPEIGEFHSCALTNTLIYEYGGIPDANGIRLPSGLRYFFPGAEVFAASQRGEWERNLAGGNDAQNLGRVTSMAMEMPDYLLLPTDAAVDYLERHRPENFINLRVRELKKRLLGTGRWTSIGGPIEISPDESVEIYVRKPPSDSLPVPAATIPPSLPRRD